MILGVTVEIIAVCSQGFIHDYIVLAVVVFFVPGFLKCNSPPVAVFIGVVTFSTMGVVTLLDEIVVLLLVCI